MLFQKLLGNSHPLAIEALKSLVGVLEKQGKGTELEAMRREALGQGINL
jgi:hypothetical protein